jgi:O-antigen/teichoic acid export membrane protein
VFIRNVFYTFSTEIFSLGATFLTGVVLARALTTSERGLMALVMTFPMIVASFAHLGLSQANIYLVGRKKQDAAMVFGNALVIAIVAGLLCVVILNLVKDFALPTVLKGLPPEYWLPLILLVPALLIDIVTLSTLRARQLFGLYNLRRLVTSVSMFIGFVIVLVIGRGGLLAATSVYIAITIFMVVFSLILVKKEVTLTLTFNRRLTGALLRFGSKSYLQNLVGVLNYRLGIFLLAYYLGPEQVAFYAVAAALAEVAWYFPNSVGVVLFPRLSKVPPEEMHRITARVCRDTLTITGIIVVGMLAASWLFVPLVYGAPYRASVLPLLILLPGVISMGIFKVLTRNFTSRNRQQISILASSVALALIISLNLILIPRWGVEGAAFASTIGYTAAGMVLLTFFLRDSKLLWQEVLLPRRSELVGHLYWAKERFQERWERF